MSATVPKERLYDGPSLWLYLKTHYRKVEDTSQDDAPLGDINRLENKKPKAKKGRGQASYGVLNGRRLTPTDVRWLAKLRRGKIPGVTLDKIDHLATYYDLPFWELLEAGGEIDTDLGEDDAA